LQGINVNCGLLILSVVAILLPSLLSETHTEAKDSSSELMLSRFESVILLLCYGLYLVFQLCTHRHYFEGVEDDGAPEQQQVEERPGSSSRARGSGEHSEWHHGMSLLVTAGCSAGCGGLLCCGCCGGWLRWMRCCIGVVRACTLSQTGSISETAVKQRWTCGASGTRPAFA
jgi:calcium/proton exchanger cax